MFERVEADLDDAERAQNHRRVDVAHMGDAKCLAGEVADAGAEHHAAFFLAVALQRRRIVAVRIVTVVTVLERSFGSAMLKPSTWPSDHTATARRTASASRRWRRKTFSSSSSYSMSIALRSANSRCTGAVPAYFW